MAAVAVPLRRHVRQTVKVGGLCRYPHKVTGRDGAQVAGDGQGGAHRLRVLQLGAEPDLVGQAHGGARPAVGIAGQEHLRARLGRTAGQFSRAQLAAQPVGPLDQRHVDARRDEPVRRREPADPAPDDDRAHPRVPFSLG